MRIFRKLINLLNKKEYQKDLWKSYYKEEENSIKITTKGIYEFMKSQVDNDLDTYALNYFGTRTTYREMFHKIDTISRSLKALGVKKGDVVTICMPNTPEAVETFYAINNIGAVADMIHPLSAENEIKQYLIDTDSRVLIIYNANYKKVKNIIEDTKVFKTILLPVSISLPPLLSIGYKFTKGIAIEKPKRSNPDYLTWNKFLSISSNYKRKPSVKVNAKDLAVILHSGGTTGHPKGIMLSNSNFNAEAQQISVIIKNLGRNDKILTIMPIFHGFGICVCVHVPFCLKAEVALVPEFDGKKFPKLYQQQKPSFLVGVPTLFEAMMNNDGFDNIDLSNLKYVVSGGDTLSIAMEEKLNNFLRTHGANISVTKGYGMTECVAGASFTIEGTNEKGSIGIPLAGNQMCIVKPGTTEELPLGEEGEICICGHTVMMGYLNKKEETDNIIKIHADGQRWLHSGDLGYIGLNGVIYFTQRLKRMIISSGFNVYPKMIEEAINKHYLVRTSCVIGIPHKYKVSVAKAYVVLNDKKDATEKAKRDILALCKKELAAYSQPKEIEFIDELPQTLMRKVDFKKLEEKDNKNEKK